MRKVVVPLAAGEAAGVEVEPHDELEAVMAALSLRAPTPVLVLAGGAGSLREGERDALRDLFEGELAPAVASASAAVVDGGTDVGVMRLMGMAREAGGHRFPLVGVVARGAVAGSDGERLEPHHTAFVLVPGDRWGDEAPWLSAVATALAGGAPSATVLVHGAAISRTDVRTSLDAGRPVLVVAGTGGLADALAEAAAEGRLPAEVGPDAELVRVVAAAAAGRELDDALSDRRSTDG